jgi:hypothetical protein
MTDNFTCENCGAVASDKGHLCAPLPVEDACSLCKQPMKDARHLCKAMVGKLEYQCSQCGRATDDPELVCKPEKIC